MAERILVVDDDPATREGLTMLLGTLGYRVAAASDGATALEALRAEPPDILLLDLVLPGDMSGIQLLQTARQVAPHVGAIIMTGYPSAETTVEALRLGAFDYLTKPFDLGRMSSLLTQLVNRLRQERQTANTLRQLETISRCKRSGIYTLNPAGVFTFWGCAGLLGYAAEEMTGRQTPGALVVSPGFDLRDELEVCRREGSTVREHRVRCKDGVVLSVRTKLVALADAQGHPIGYAAYLLDVGDERRLQTTQQQRILEMQGRLQDQARLVEVVQSLGEIARGGASVSELVARGLVGALHVVRDGRAAWCFLRDGKGEGLPAVPVDGDQAVFLGGAAHATRDLQRLGAGQCDTGACECVRGLTQERVASPRPRLVVCPRLHAFGGVAARDSLCHLSLPLVFRGEVLGLLNVVKDDYGPFAADETARLSLLADTVATTLAAGRLAEKTQEAARQLRESRGRAVRVERLRAVGELASGVAHDFNNLLTAILGSAELLLREEKDPQRLEELQTIRRAAQDGAETVRRILEYTRVRREREVIHIDLPAVIREAVDLTRGRWRNAVQARGATIDVQLDLQAVPPVAGNPSELRELLTNLILNAADAMPDGGRLRLAARPVSQGNGARSVEILVEDTGTGMAPEVLERVFDPFFTTKEGTGAGLGLAVAYGIVECHQGEIAVRSEPGRGTTFAIRLPAVAGEMVESAAHRSAAVGQGVSATLPGKPVGRSARILVVDDEPKLAQLLQAFLELQGHRVSTATSGAAALALLGNEAFDLLLTDLGMPEMSGWDVAREARRLQPRLSVIMVSGWGAQIDPQQVAETGVAEVIQKPYTFETVHEAIETLLSQQRAAVSGQA